MSQNASMSQTNVVNASEPGPEGQVFNAADTELPSPVYELEDGFASVADRLMDTIFADVERMLERGVDLSPEPEPLSIPTVPESLWLVPPDDLVHAAAHAASPVSSANAAANGSAYGSAKLSPRPSLLERAETPEELADLAKLMAEVTEETAPSNPTHSFDKLLLSLIVASVIATGGLWFYFRDRFQPSPSVAVAPPSAEQLQQQKNQEFLSYVGRSLDRIEQDAKAQREAAAIAATGASPSPAASPSTVLERVYIPVYQTPPAGTSLPSPPVSLPRPALAQPAPATAAASPTAPAVAAPNIASASAKHVLLGVLELGDRSAALFEINGTPERVQMGEAIGNSGWTLVSIQNQEAIVRRNGEVRSIYVGQQF